MVVKIFLAPYECFCLPSLNDCFVLSMLFPSSVKALCSLWPDNCPPLLQKLSLPPGMLFCRCPKETNPISIIFPYRNSPWEREKDPALFLEGTSLPQWQKVSPKSKGLPLNDKALLSHPHLQLLLPPADFPKGLHLAAVHWEGQAVMAAQLAQCCWPVCSLIRLSPDGGSRKEELGLVQHNTKLHKLWAGTGKASGRKSQELKYHQDSALALSPLSVRLISTFVCSKVRGTLLSYSIRGCDI